MNDWDKALIDETRKGHKIVVDSGYLARGLVRYFVTAAQIVVESVDSNVLTADNSPFSTHEEVWAKVQKMADGR